jgi:hypothetical protein
MISQSEARNPARGRQRLRRIQLATVLLLLGVVSGTPQVARADEGGVSFWVPGFFGSLAAAPVQPGWSVATIYYHTSVDAGGDVAFARQVTRGNLNVNFAGNLRAVLDADVDIGFVSPSYTFATPVLFGGQLTVATLAAYGRSEAAVDATLTGALGPIGFTVSGGASDTVTGFADLPLFANLRWNAGVHNYMTYIAGNLPVGSYEAASGIPRWIAASATPTSTHRPATNSRRCWALPTISRTITPSIRTVSTCTSTWPPPSS